MLMSHEAISSGLAALPRLGPSASAPPHPTTSAEQATRNALRIDMFDLAALCDAPAGNPVEMVIRPPSAIGNELGPRRLHVSGFFGRAVLGGGRAAIPSPGGAEPRDRLWQNRLLERRQRPASAAVGGDFDLRDPSIAGP